MAADEQSPARIRLITASVIIGIFVAGAAAGFGLARGFAPSRHDERPPPPLGRLVADLGLAGDQRARADAIADRFERDVDEIMQGAFPKIRELHDTAIAELRALLTPEQAARLDALEAARPPGGHRGPHHHGPRGPRGPDRGPHDHGDGDGPPGPDGPRRPDGPPPAP